MTIFAPESCVDAINQISKRASNIRMAEHRMISIVSPLTVDFGIHHHFLGNVEMGLGYMGKKKHLKHVVLIY